MEKDPYYIILGRRRIITYIELGRAQRSYNRLAAYNPIPIPTTYQQGERKEREEDQPTSAVPESSARKRSGTRSDFPTRTASGIDAPPHLKSTLHL